MKSDLLAAMAVGIFMTSQSAAEEVDYARLQLAHTLEGHEGTIRAIAVSPDGRTLASGGHDRTVRLWDVESGKVNAVLQGHEAAVRVLRFSPDGRLLASGAYGGDGDLVRLWDVAEKKQLSAVTHAKTHTRAMAFSPDGTKLAWDNRGKETRLCDVPTGKKMTVLPVTGIVREIVFSRDGQNLAFPLFHDEGFQVWRADGKLIGAVKGKFTTAQFSPDGKTLTAGEFRKVSKWQVTDAMELKSVDSVAPPGVVADPFFRVRLLPRGKLATVDKDSAIVNLGGDVGSFGAKRCRLIVMDLSSAKERTLMETRGRDNWFDIVSHSPDGSTVVVRHVDYSFTLVDVDSGERRTRLTSPDIERGSGYPQIAFDPNGQTVAVSRGKRMKVWTLPK